MNSLTLPSLGLLVLAIVFLIGGISRIVEFNGLDFGSLQKKILITAHILGCILFSGAMALTALDSGQIHKTLITIALFSALGILLPLHIFVGLKRRIKMRDQQGSSSN